MSFQPPKLSALNADISAQDKFLQEHFFAFIPVQHEHILESTEV